MSSSRKRTLEVAEIEDNQQHQPNKQPKQEENKVLGTENQSHAETFESHATTSEEIEDSENDHETETICSVYEWWISEQSAQKIRNWKQKEETEEKLKIKRQAAKKLLKEIGAFRKSKGKNEEFDVDQDEDDIDSKDFEIFSYDELHLAYSSTSTP